MLDYLIRMNENFKTSSTFDSRVQLMVIQKRFVDYFYPSNASGNRRAGFNGYQVQSRFKAFICFVVIRRWWELFDASSKLQTLNMEMPENENFYSKNFFYVLEHASRLRGMISVEIRHRSQCSVFKTFRVTKGIRWIWIKLRTWD